MNNDLISREALSKYFHDISTKHHYEKLLCNKEKYPTVADVIEEICYDIDNAPAVEPFEKIGAICNENCGYNPQGKYVDISKLRLMTVEECAGHTIDYAMGWKACIEWIKKGGADNETD